VSLHDAPPIWAATRGVAAVMSPDPRPLGEVREGGSGSQEALPTAPVLTRRMRPLLRAWRREAAYFCQQTPSNYQRHGDEVARLEDPGLRLLVKGSSLGVFAIHQKEPSPVALRPDEAPGSQLVEVEPGVDEVGPRLLSMP